MFKLTVFPHSLYSTLLPSQPISPSTPSLQSLLYSSYPLPQVTLHGIQMLHIDHAAHACSLQTAISMVFPRQPLSPGEPFRHSLCLLRLPSAHEAEHSVHIDHLGQACVNKKSLNTYEKYFSIGFFKSLIYHLANGIT